MKNYRTPRKEETSSRRARRASQKKVMLIGWIFLGVMLAAALAAVILLLPGRDKAPDTEDRPLSVPQMISGKAKDTIEETEQTAPPIETGNAGSGRRVSVNRFDCDYTPPETVTLGVLKSVDLTALGETVAANVAANGWGSVTYSVSENGSLLLQNPGAPALTTMKSRRRSSPRPGRKTRRARFWNTADSSACCAATGWSSARRRRTITA